MTLSKIRVLHRYQASVDKLSLMSRRRRNLVRLCWRRIWIRSSAKKKSTALNSNSRKRVLIKFLNIQKRGKPQWLMVILMTKWTPLDKLSIILTTIRWRCFSKIRKSLWRNSALTITMPYERAQFSIWTCKVSWIWNHPKPRQRNNLKRQLMGLLMPMMWWKTIWWYLTACPTLFRFKKAFQIVEFCHPWDSSCFSYTYLLSSSNSTWSSCLRSNSMVPLYKPCTIC